MNLHPITDVAKWVDARPAKLGSTRLVCIDGPAGSGKTTFAANLARQLQAPIVHMDDLYEGWEGTFEPALATRIEAWILTPLRHGLPPRHPRYDWAAGRYNEWIDIPVDDHLIIEGVRAGARAIRQYATLVIWVESADHLRLDRVLQRDGASIRSAMLEFQAQEHAHFEQDQTREAADVLVRGDPIAAHGPSEFFGEALGT